MTINAESLDGIVSAEWPQLRIIGQPEPLTGGFWAEMWRLRVSDQPNGMPPDLVLRHAPHREMGAKETEVQRAISEQGFRTPAVWLSRPDEGPMDGWWSVMDFCHGAPLLAGLDPAGVLRRAPFLLRMLPRQLADAMAALHGLDPEPVTEAVRYRAPDVAWTVDEVVEQFRFGADMLERPDVAAALDRLTSRRPAPCEPVICHGDLHPFNMLADAGGLTVLDWTGSVLADPRFDVAYTELLLANPPLALPAPLAVLARRAGRLFARRFVGRYAAANPTVTLDGLEWFRALHSARIVIELTLRRAEHGAGAGGHPFAHIARAAAKNLSTATGVEVGP